MKPYYEHGGIVIYHGDCRDVLPLLEAQTIDVILTDPQFFLPPVGHGTRGRENEFCGSLGDLVMLESAYQSIFDQFKRILRHKGHLYMNCHDKSYPVFFRLAYTRWPRVSCLVWYKPTGRVGGGWRRSYELILHGAYPETQYSKQFRQDVIGIMPVRTLKRQHPAEKPIDLGDFILSATSNATSLLDPFMGSGSYLVAAKTRFMAAIGIEIEEKYCEIAAKRLSQEVLL